MIKLFISDDLIINYKSGKFCMKGYRNDCTFQYYSITLTPSNTCNHRTCFGYTLNITTNPEFCLSVHRNFNYAYGDNDKSDMNNVPQVLILIYNHLEICSLIPICTKEFLSNVGDDITFILQNTAKKYNVKLLKKTEDEYSSNNFISSNDNGLISKLCQRSYLWRLARYKAQSFSQNSISTSLIGMVMEFVIAVAFIVLLSYCLLTNGVTEYHLSNLKSGIIMLVKLLQDLLTWLMGVPVGFKLNRPLSRVLGQFYMFHVTIWENYMMSVIYPIVPFLVAVTPWLTPLGICFFLCLFLDVLSLVSLHVICFYVYACKLYRFQVVILCSLYRLFHGQKWNPFRQRVDTGPPDIDRLFTSTLILALCVFLLPTTAIYYFVFTMFDLLLLLVEFLVCSIVEAILQVPVMDLLTWLCWRPCHRKIVEIRPVCQSINCFAFSVRFHRVPFSSIFHRQANFVRANIRPPLNVSEVLINILKGFTFKRLPDGKF